MYNENRIHNRSFFIEDNLKLNIFNKYEHERKVRILIHHVKIYNTA